MMRLYGSRLDSPIGPITILAGPEGICWIGFGPDVEDARRPLERRFGSIEVVFDRGAGDARAALQRYFAGDLHAIDPLPVDPGGTDFQRSVWAELRTIPCGGTLTYGELARRVGSPGGSRAVGAANGRNPVPIVLPCHRVVAAGGRLGGYGGGLAAKEWLLRHERGWPAGRRQAGQPSLFRSARTPA